MSRSVSCTRGRLFFALLAITLGATSAAGQPAARAQVIAEGLATLRKHECNRCHVIDALEPAERPLNCVACHQFLEGLSVDQGPGAELARKYGPELIERYQRNITHLVHVPDLTGLGRRVKPSWIARYVQQPHDVRPLLEESMIRNKVGEDDANTIARYFAAMGDAPEVDSVPGARPDAARLAQGKALFTTRGCVICHTFGNVPTGIDAATLRANRAVAELAPNLRFVRERMRHEAIVPWILEPKKLLPSTAMPALGLTREEAELVRDWLLFEDPQLAPMPAIAPVPVPRALPRRVSWEEVKERVLGKVCVHCHMNDYEKDTGPGNQGGLGFAGVKLRMRTYESLVSGAIDATGRRYSVLTVAKGEHVPPIVQALLRRRSEAARDAIAPFQDHVLPPYTDKPGMPLGLPAMTDEEIAILRTWIDQGCKGPVGVTGKPGINDGLLVPDGPIEKNVGCELRAPGAVRPAWAVETEAKRP